MTTDITVLMPVYNGEKYLREAIDSVLLQTYRDFEFLIVNDGSTDATENIIRSYKDPRIQLINQANGGVSKALNTGLQHAIGQYIARFDADDMCYPNRLQLQYDFMKTHPGYVIVGADADYMDKQGEYIFTFTMPGHSDHEIKDTLMQACPFIHSAVMYKKEAVLALGGYEVKAHGFEDYFLWTRLLRTGKGFNFNEALIKVRFNPESVTVDSRDYSPAFRRIHGKALESGEITNAEEQEILASIQTLDKRKKELSYHRMLGKKFLWNNYQPAKARQHLLKAIGLKPFDGMAYVLFAFSFLPKKLIHKLYARLK